jgi:hypothetical protein
MGGIPAQAKRPGRPLATGRITPAIVLAEELPDVAARWRGITRGLQGEKACEAARGTVKRIAGKITGMVVTSVVAAF